MSFRDDFIWGAGASSYQIEGAARTDGKGASVWDDFCAQPGRIFEGDTGDIACDHYNRYEQDIELMAEIGIKAYRFSISWPRILPEGTGKINQKGLDYYKRMVECLLSHNITPYCTLFHWEYPSELLKLGGWMNPNSSDWFAEYVSVVAENLGGYIKNYVTLNEPQCFIGLSYYKTEHAPGLSYSLKDNLLMAHNVLLAHGKSVQALRSYSPDCKIGYAPTGNTCFPVTDSDADVEAARIANFQMDRQNWTFNISWWSDPVILGNYPADGIKLFEDILPVTAEDDLKTICQPLDYYGQNIYNSSPVASDGNGGYVHVKFPVGHAKTAMGWPVTPESLYWIPKFLYERYNLPIIITENGLSCHDTISLDGKVHDPNRIDFMDRYLINLKKASEHGIPILGYFHWSVMDNFEWAKGYSERFGLIYVNYENQERIIKDSAFHYRDIINSNGEIL